MPNPDGSATLEELANFVIQKEAQPVALGPEAVVTPEQTGLMEADIAAQGGAPPQQPAQITPLGEEPVSFDVVRQKFLSGTPMTQAEIDFMTRQVNQPGGATNVLLSDRARQLIGETTAQLAAPGLGTAVGGAIGSMILPGVGTAFGAALGSLAGTEFNMRVGLEKDSDIQRVLSFLAPQLGTFTSRVGRGVFKATPAGQALRSEFATNISENVGQQVLKAPGKILVGAAFDNLRRTGGKISLQSVGKVVDELDPVFQNALKNQIKKFGKGPQSALARITAPKAPEALSAVERAKLPLFQKRQKVLTVEELADPARFKVDVADVMELRRAIRDAKDAAFRRSGIGAAAGKKQGKEFSKVATALDDNITEAARAGNPAAQELQEANILARMQFAQDDINELFAGARSSQTLGDRSIIEFNIKKIDTALDKAQLAIRQGREHKLAGLVRSLNEFGDLKEFKSALRQLRQLSPKNNPQLFGESFGLITRAAQFAARTTGANLIGEVMLNKASRNTFLKLIRATNGRFSIPILATAAAVGRAASGQPLDEVSQKIVEKLVREKEITTEEELRQVRAPEIGTESVAFPGGGATRPAAPPTSTLEPAPGPFFGPGRTR